MSAPLPQTPYWQSYQGNFTGLLNWPDVEAFWQVLASSGQPWFLFDPQAPAPEQPLTAEEFAARLHDMQALINTRRSNSHCFALFVDDPETPTFVKVFDPKNLGASCGCSKERTWPRWTLSLIQPETLPVPEPAPKLGFWGRLGAVRHP